MGERKGQNKYYPPDYDPKCGGLNKWQGVHALRERGRKAHLGIIIIRFEMPYNIWCDGCQNHIGMGVRYNAEKTKVGMYYTTPVFEFKMKCHLCDNHFVIKTDPGNLDYVILSGARRQENRWDPTQNEQIVPETKETQKRLFDDAMYKLEHGTDDKDTATSEQPRLVNLYARNEDTWADCYTVNQKMRAEFRKKSLDLKQSAAIDQALLAKSSLNIHLLPETNEDRKMAELLSRRLTPLVSASECSSERRKRLITRPSLPSTNLDAEREQKALKVMRRSFDAGVLVKRKCHGGDTESVTSSTSGSSEENITCKRSKMPDEEDTSSINSGLIGAKCEVRSLNCSADSSTCTSPKANSSAADSSKLSLVCDYSSSGDSD